MIYIVDISIKTSNGYITLFDNIRPTLSWISYKMPNHEYHQNMFTYLTFEKIKENNLELQDWQFAVLKNNNRFNNFDANNW